MNCKLFYYAMVLVLCFSILPANGQDAGKVSGIAFGDFFYMATNHDKNIEGENGFQFRRIYLTFDRKLSSEYSMRFRLEMSDKGDFATKAKLEPVVKDAYLRWSKNGHNIYMGISGTPTWGVTESVWGYRSVEKTIVDLQKVGSSRDFGVAFKGKFDDNGKVSYHLMVGNGNSNSSEVGPGKKLLTSLAFRPDNDFILEGYFDIDDPPDRKRKTTVQGFLGRDGDNHRFGVQFIRQWKKVGQNIDDETMDLLSVWGARQLNDKFWGYARYDRSFDPNSSGSKIAYIPFDPTAESNLVLIGLDYSPVENVHFMPNFEAIFYDENSAGVSPDADFVPRLTVSYIF